MGFSALPLGYRSRVNFQLGGKLPPGQPRDDSGSLELQRKPSRGWPERVIGQEGDGTGLPALDDPI